MVVSARCMVSRGRSRRDRMGESCTAQHVPGQPLVGAAKSQDSIDGV